MKIVKYLFFVLFSLNTLFLAGCVSTGIQTQFLKNTNVLTPDPKKNEILYFTDQNFHLYSYTKVLIDPVEFRLHPKFSDYQLTSEELRKIRIKYYMAVTSALQNRYEVVSVPAADVLRVRSAILNVKPDEKPLEKRARNAFGIPLVFDDMIVELDMVDSLTGERLANFVHTKARFLLESKRVYRFSEFDPTVQALAKFLRQALDKTYKDGGQPPQ